MRDRTKNLFSNSVSETAIFLLVACLLGYTMSQKFWGDSPILSTAFLFWGGVIGVAWLIWLTYVVATKKVLKRMEAKPLVSIETLTRAFLLLWVYMRSGSIAIVMPFFLFFVWQEYRLIDDLKDSEHT